MDNTVAAQLESLRKKWAPHSNSAAPGKTSDRNAAGMSLMDEAQALSADRLRLAERSFAQHVLRTRSGGDLAARSLCL